MPKKENYEEIEFLKAKHLKIKFHLIFIINLYHFFKKTSWASMENYFIAHNNLLILILIASSERSESKNTSQKSYLLILIAC
jgi:hypothetical protein